MKYIFLTSLLTILSFITIAQSFTRTELATELDKPWEITFGPDGYLWLTERDGVVSRVNPINGEKQVVFQAADYFAGSPLESSGTCSNAWIKPGTLGLTLDPDFLNPNNSFIYFVYSYNSGTAEMPATKFRIKRLKWDANKNLVVDDSNVVNLIPTGYDHLGGRLLAVKQNGISYLYLTVGDNGISDENSPDCYSPQSSNPNNFAQDITTKNGKIHRFYMDGTIPEDNPISGNSFYTRGHRNPQGLIYNPNLNILYNVEHGDRTDDEINILIKGMNYGWKNVRGYRNDNSYPGESDYAANYIANPIIENDSLVDAFYSWCTEPSTSSEWKEWCTVAPSGGDYYGHAAIPEWTNSLLVVTLKDGVSTDREVYQFKLQPNGELVQSVEGNPNPKKFFGKDQGQNGRLRDIAISNDGKSIYLINNGGDGGPSPRITVYTYYDVTTSVKNTLGHDKNLQAYPNPVNGNLRIKGLETLSNIDDIQIFSPQGKKLSVSYDNDFNIDVSNYMSGIYIVIILSNEKMYSLKFYKHL